MNPVYSNLYLFTIRQTVTIIKYAKLAINNSCLHWTLERKENYHWIAVIWKNTAEKGLATTARKNKKGRVTKVKIIILPTI